MIFLTELTFILSRNHLVTSKYISRNEKIIIYFDGDQTLKDKKRFILKYELITVIRQQL
jgi:hypothetical protein